MRSKESKLDFSGQVFYVGIDVHKKNWQVSILSNGRKHKSMSQPPSAKVLADYLHRMFPCGTYLAVYEAGFSGFTACRELNALGVHCKMVHPMDIPTSHKEKQQKSDRIDSRKLARLLQDDYFTGIDIPGIEVEIWRSLLRQRFRVVRDLARTKSRVKSLLFQFGIEIPDYINSSSSRHWSGSYLNWLRSLNPEENCLQTVIGNYISMGESLREQLLKINRQIRQLSETEAFRQNRDLLLGIPGIGMTTAMVLLCELYDIRRFKTLDTLCSFVGLVPRMYNSGDKERTGRMVKRGRKQLKIMLIEAAWEAVSADPALMLYFNNLSKRMHKNKAIIRIARRLLSRIRYVLIHQQEYVTGITG